MSRAPTATLLAALLLAATGCEPKLPERETPPVLVYANDGWSHRDRQIFYYTPQGTQLHGLRYSWFTNFELPFSSRSIADREILSRFGFLYDRDATEETNALGLPIGFTYHEDPAGHDAFLDITCAACHTGELHYRDAALRIDGGQAMHAVASMDLGQFFPTLAVSMMHTYVNPFAFDRFAERVLGVEYPEQKAELREVLGRTLKLFVREGWEGRNLYPTKDGFGRTDALGHISNAVLGFELSPQNYRLANAPVSFPHLWDIWKFDWVQWNGSAAQAMGRNVGEALGVKAFVELIGPHGEAVPAARKFESSVLIEELNCLETTLWKLQPPRWDAAPDGSEEPILPEINEDEVKMGRGLFEAHCRGCHGPHRYPVTRRLPSGERITVPAPTPGKPFEWQMVLIASAEIGTDPATAGNFANYYYDASAVNAASPHLSHVNAGDALNHVTRAVVKKKYDALRMSDEERWWFDGFGRGTEVQTLRAYKARPLHGIWATPPFLHNGSVPNLYELLLPEEERSAEFWMGTHRFDPKKVGYETAEIEGGFRFDTRVPGNRNTGHQFRDDGGAGVIGPELSDEERYAIIEYLKVLGNPKYRKYWWSPADPRTPEEIGFVQVPEGFPPRTSPGLPPPDCTSLSDKPIQGPAALSPQELPENLAAADPRQAR